MLPNPDFNYLPMDGMVRYFGPIAVWEKDASLWEALSQEIPWQKDQVHLFGKTYTTRRKVAWFADLPTEYNYSGFRRQSFPWPSHLGKIKKEIERILGTGFQSCLANYYHDGEDSMGWHSDDERVIPKRSPIASVSFGAERTFVFRHKTNFKTVSLELENASLLLMENETQEFWKHALPKRKRVQSPRINLTFRQVFP